MTAVHSHWQTQREEAPSSRAARVAMGRTSRRMEMTQHLMCRARELCLLHYAKNRCARSLAKAVPRHTPPPARPPSHCIGLTTTSHRSPRVLLLHRYRRWYLQRRVPSGRTPPTTTTPRHHRRLPLSGGGDARTVAVQRRRVRSEARSKARQRYRRCHPLHRAMRRRFRGSARCLPPPPISSKLSVGRARTHPRRYQEVLAARRAR